MNAPIPDGLEVTVAILVGEIRSAEGHHHPPHVALWRGFVDNAFMQRMNIERYKTAFRHDIPLGCFVFNGAGVTCFVRVADEGTVWIRGHVTHESEAGRALLAAWHMGNDRVIGLGVDQS